MKEFLKDRNSKWFFAGLIVTLFYLINLADIPFAGKIVLDLIAMFGSGISCSVIVAYIVNKNQKEKLELKANRQCRVIFSNLFNQIIRLLQGEIKQLSELYYLYEKHESYIVKKEDTILNLIDVIKDKLGKINLQISKDLCSPCMIDKEWLNIEKKKQVLAFQSMTPIYKILNSTIISLLSESNVYFINDIINSNQMHALENLKSLIDCIIDNYSSGQEIEIILEYKEILFGELKENLIALNINYETKIFFYEYEEKSRDNNRDNN